MGGRGPKSCTHSSIAEVEVEEVFILDLGHLDDGLIVHALRMCLHFGTNQLVFLVGVEALPHGNLLRSYLMPAPLLPSFTHTDAHCMNTHFEQLSKMQFCLMT